MIKKICKEMNNETKIIYKDKFKEEIKKFETWIKDIK